jgi:hypothetical protein
MMLHHGGGGGIDANAQNEDGFPTIEYYRSCLLLFQQ